MGCTHEMKSGSVVTVVSAGGLIGGCSFCKAEALESRAAALEAELRAVLRSSIPHPVHHPTMWGAWRQAEALLGIPPEKSHTIGTSDRALEARLLAEATQRRSAETKGGQHG